VATSIADPAVGVVDAVLWNDRFENEQPSALTVIALPVADAQLISVPVFRYMLLTATFGPLGPVPRSETGFVKFTPPPVNRYGPESRTIVPPFTPKASCAAWSAAVSADAIPVDGT
jgi:hypothetical protein